MADIDLESIAGELLACAKIIRECKESSDKSHIACERRRISTICHNAIIALKLLENSTDDTVAHLADIPATILMGRLSVSQHNLILQKCNISCKYDKAEVYCTLNGDICTLRKFAWIYSCGYIQTHTECTAQVIDEVAVFEIERYEGVLGKLSINFNYKPPKATIICPDDETYATV